MDGVVEGDSEGFKDGVLEGMPDGRLDGTLLIEGASLKEGA
jgi:hypothetical protein